MPGKATGSDADPEEETEGNGEPGMSEEMEQENESESGEESDHEEDSETGEESDREDDSESGEESDHEDDSESGEESDREDEPGTGEPKGNEDGSETEEESENEEEDEISREEILDELLPEGDGAWIIRNFLGAKTAGTADTTTCPTMTIRSSARIIPGLIRPRRRRAIIISFTRSQVFPIQGQHIGLRMRKA